MKEIYTDECFPGILKAAKTLGETVGITMGPSGRTVAIEGSFGSPHVTKDGYTVAKNIECKDKRENIPMQIMIQSAIKTNEETGDGTTTATVFLVPMVKECIKAKMAGRNPRFLRSGMEKMCNLIIEDISSRSRQISSPEEIIQVATISANGDQEIGKVIADSMEKVGKMGVITCEEGKGADALECQIVTGMQFDRGYLSPYFITNTKKMTIELDNPMVLITDKKITSAQHVVPALEAAASKNKPLLIIAEDVEGEALATLVLNKLRGAMKIAAVKAPGFGEKKKDMLKDIAILTGAQVVSEDAGSSIENDDMSLMLGSAKSIKITKDDTTIVDGEGNSSEIDERVKQIQAQIDESNSEYEIEKMKERLAKLAGGVAVIKVGGSTEVETKERKDRADDALHATRAAVAEGVIAGSGAALLYALKSDKIANFKGDNDDEEAAANIVRKALRAPISQILRNSGEEDSVVIGKLLAQDNVNWILDAKTFEYVDAFSAGIIDPVKVTKSAVRTAISTALLIATTDAIIAEVKGDDDNDAPAGGGMPMGGMGGMGGMGF